MFVIFKHIPIPLKTKEYKIDFTPKIELHHHIIINSKM